MRSGIIGILLAWMLTTAAAAFAVEKGVPATLPDSFYTPPAGSSSDEVAPLPEGEPIPIPASPAVENKVQATTYTRPMPLRGKPEDGLFSKTAFTETIAEENKEGFAKNSDSPKESAAVSNSGMKSIALSPHRDSSLRHSESDKGSEKKTASKTPDLPSMTTLLGSLAVVLGLFLITVWLLRRKTPQHMTKLPNEVYEVLGRGTLSGRQQVHLLRCGNKLVLVSITPAGAETITEITDPQEVDRVAGICRQTHPHSSSAAFQEVFEQLAPKRPTQETYNRELYGEFNLSNLQTAAAARRGGTRHA